jgi:molybdopterin/thiamine biosynthesis adenylyltransferase
VRKPRIKNVFPPMPLGGELIRIGGVDYGIGAEIIDDDRGHAWHLLSLVDGTRSEDDIVAAMQAYDPSLRDEEVREALSAIVEGGYVEDAATRPPPGAFTPAELQRYPRNFEFFSYFHMPPLTGFDLQLRLKQAKVTVLGVGGLGSFVALALASAGVGDLLIVDNDIVEPSNLNRQVLYTERDLGGRKCEAAARRLAEINPHVRVEPLDLKVSSVEDARRCVAGRDFLVCAADRPRVLLYDWLNAATVAEGVPWLRGANDGLTVSLFMHVPEETACFECEQMRSHALHPWYGEVLRHVTQVIGDRTINPCIAPIAGLIGNLAAFEVVKHLTGVARPVVHNRKMALDLRTMETWFSDGERQPDCPVCGAREKAAV